MRLGEGGGGGGAGPRRVFNKDTLSCGADEDARQAALPQVTAAEDEVSRW